MCKVNSPLYGQRVSAQLRQGPASQVHWVPNTDVYISDDKLIVQVELSGMRRSDLEVTVEGSRRLLIRGQRPDGTRSSKCKFLVMEISYGPFECVFEIPSGYDLDRAQASYLNGFLRVEVPQGVSPPSRNYLAPASELK